MTVADPSERTFLSQRYQWFSTVVGERNIPPAQFNVFP
jgi:hypothetical protein